MPHQEASCTLSPSPPRPSHDEHQNESQNESQGQPIDTLATKISHQVTPSRLLALPRELRDEIYAHTFSGTVQINIRCTGIRARNAGLLATCKQIRHEALKAYYQRTTFRVSDDIWRPYPLTTSFLKSVHPKYRKFITTIHVDCSGYEVEGCAKIYEDGDEPGSNFFARQRRVKLEILAFFEKKLDKEGTSVKDGVLKTRVLAWNGRFNKEVWTATPLNEPMPRFKDAEQDEKACAWEGPGCLPGGRGGGGEFARKIGAWS